MEIGEAIEMQGKPDAENPKPVAVDGGLGQKPVAEGQKPDAEGKKPVAAGK